MIKILDEGRVNQPHAFALAGAPLNAQGAAASQPLVNTTPSMRRGEGVAGVETPLRDSVGHNPLEASGGQAMPMPETGPTEPARSATQPAPGTQTPGTKPLRAIQLVNGRCACTQCRADEAREQERSDAALIAAIYDLGLEQLRRAALDRIPAFQEAFRNAG